MLRGKVLVMRLFFKYIKGHWCLVLISILFLLIFTTSFLLYHLPIEAVLYPTLLCMGIAILFIGFDFLRVKKEYRTLQQIQSITDAVPEIFPKVYEIKEEAYQDVIYRIKEEQQSFCQKSNQNYADMVDYYTLWAHQIKTPVASMRLYLQNEDSPLSRKLLSELYRIEQYVEMVLTFLRLNSESTDYVIRECDLDDMIKQAVKKFSSEFISRKLTLVYEPVHSTVITDEKWFSFVIEQILSNSLKYTQTGSITITLEKEKTLRIKDTGIGIAPEDLPRIFEKAYTGYNGRMDKKASGIGLYLCKRICEKLGHKITACSVLDVGTTIDIDLVQRNLELY